MARFLETIERRGDVKTGNLPVRESRFILYEIVIYDALMSDLAEWIQYRMLEMSPDEVKYSIIFAHICISIIHEIYFLSITIKASLYCFFRATKESEKSLSNMA